MTVETDELVGIAEIANPSTCQAYTAPSALTTGCGSKAPSSIVSTPSASALPIVEGGMSSSTKRALGFAVGGVLAIGAVLLMRKKK